MPMNYSSLCIKRNEEYPDLKTATQYSSVFFWYLDFSLFKTGKLELDR